jgi:hypothetical protein
MAATADLPCMEMSRKGINQHAIHIKDDAKRRWCHLLVLQCIVEYRVTVSVTLSISAQ